MNILFTKGTLILIILININIIISKNLKCPNNILINVGLKSTKGLSIVSINENKYKSNLSEKERENYEQMIDLKRSFSSSMDKVYNSFSPEKEGYWQGLNSVTFLFFSFSLILIIVIIIYLVLRFFFKKCSGPRKATDISRCYRNSAWVFMILSSITVFILFTIILAYSVNVNNSVKKTFDRASELINYNSKLYTKINETVTDFKSNNLTIPDEELMSSFKTNINKYVKTTKQHTDDIINGDYNRNVGMILLYVYYLIAIILAYVFFALKWKIPEGILFILLLFTIPSMLIFAGYNYKFFFFYADLCGSVNSALYKNEFPVTGQSLGYYYNCFDRQTKAELYGIRFSLYKSAISTPINQEEIMNKYNTLNNEVLSSQLNCEIVTEIVPKIEKDFCKDSLSTLNDIIQLMIWLLLVTTIMAISVRLLENLIWKKKAEIESMIENLEQIY